MKEYLQGKNQGKAREKELFEAEERRKHFLSKFGPIINISTPPPEREEYNTMTIYTRNQDDKIASLLHVHNVVWSATQSGVIHIWDASMSGLLNHSSRRPMEDEKKERTLHRPEEEWISRFVSFIYFFVSILTPPPTPLRFSLVKDGEEVSVKSLIAVSTPSEIKGQDDVSVWCRYLILPNSKNSNTSVIGAIKVWDAPKKETLILNETRTPEPRGTIYFDGAIGGMKQCGKVVWVGGDSQVYHIRARGCTQQKSSALLFKSVGPPIPVDPLVGVLNEAVIFSSHKNVFPLPLPTLSRVSKSHLHTIFRMVERAECGCVVIMGAFMYSMGRPAIS